MYKPADQSHFPVKISIHKMIETVETSLVVRNRESRTELKKEKVQETAEERERASRTELKRERTGQGAKERGRA